RHQGRGRILARGAVDSVATALGTAVASAAMAAERSLLSTSSFRVLIGDRELAFAEVTQLTSTTDWESSREQLHRFEPVVLRRALTRSSELYDWRRRVVEGADDRRTVTIE